jgi:hypothetical protein
MHDPGKIPPSSLTLSLRVFAAFLVIYLCSWAGHYTSGDGAHKIAWAKAMMGQSPGMSPDQNGVYSKYGIGHSLLAMPGLEVSHLIQKHTGVRTEAMLYTLLFVMNGALFLALVAYYLGHFYPARAVWGTVMIIGLATIWWPYTKLDFTEPLLLTTVFIGFLVMRFGRPLLGMAIAGFSLALRPDSLVILAPLVAWYLVRNQSMRAVLKAALALTPSIALVLLANFIRYHSFADNGYSDQRFSNFFLVGLYGILISSGKGILLFSPPLLLGVLGWKRFAARRETTSDAWLFLIICAAQVLFYAKYWIWSSDDSWGERYVLPGTLLMCIPLVAVLHRRMVVIPVVLVGVLIQLLAVTVGGLDFMTLVRTVKSRRQAVFLKGTNRIDFNDLWFNPNYSQIYGNWILLRYVLHIPPQSGQSDDAEVQLVGTRLYDAIPTKDWTAAAHWDFIWNLKRSARTEVPLRQGAAAAKSLR